MNKKTNSININISDRVINAPFDVAKRERPKTNHG
jgi:hypothetical protein